MLKRVKQQDSLLWNCDSSLIVLTPDKPNKLKSLEESTDTGLASPGSPVDYEGLIVGTVGIRIGKDW
jgi:hypothetical protein